MLLSVRNTHLVIFIGCVGLILTALFMQYSMGLPPCPLCITQRVFVILVGLIALIAAIHNPPKLGQVIYGLLGIGAAATGGGVSLRQVWLQSLPEDQVPACGPGLEYMFSNFPLIEALDLLFRGDGNCAEVSWSLFGLSIPAWTAVAFAGLIGFNLWQIVRRQESR